MTYDDDTPGHQEARAAAEACFDGRQVMVEGYLLLTIAVEADTGERVWAIRSDPDQSAFTAMGLSKFAQIHLDGQVNAQIQEDEP